MLGVLLCAFGTFWVGEGMDLQWPGEDLSIPAPNALFLIAALLAVPTCRTRTPRPAPSVTG